MDGGAAVVFGSLVEVLGLVAAGAPFVAGDAVVDVEFGNHDFVGRADQADQHILAEVAVHEIDAILFLCLVGGFE